MKYLLVFIILGISSCKPVQQDSSTQNSDALVDSLKSGKPLHHYFSDDTQIKPYKMFKARDQSGALHYYFIDDGKDHKNNERQLFEVHRNKVEIEETPNTEYFSPLKYDTMRSTLTTLFVTPTPLKLTESNPIPNKNGEFHIVTSRLSDERRITDVNNNKYVSDGELAMSSFEFVSPAYEVSVSDKKFPVHFGVSLHRYTVEKPVFDQIRNQVERKVIGHSRESVESVHTTGGQELSVQVKNGEVMSATQSAQSADGVSIGFSDTAEQTQKKSILANDEELIKLKLTAQTVIHKGVIKGIPVTSSLAIGLTLPSMGDGNYAGNKNIGIDATLATAAKLSKNLRIRGAVSISFVGGSEFFDELGIDYNDSTVTAFAGVEYNITDKVIAGLGYTFNQAVTKNTDLSTDYNSHYINAGLSYKLSDNLTSSITFSENPEGAILEGYQSSYDGAQKDADFTVTIGLHYNF